MNLDNVILLDFGNSRVKARHAMKDQAVEYESGNAWHTILSEIISVSGAETLVYATVDAEKSDSLFYSPSFPNILRFDIASEVARHPHILDISLVSGFGIDRVLGMFGALTLHIPPLATVDCGTMTTINICNAEGKFLGGAIFPGLRTMAKAANDYAAQLPLADFQSIVPEVPSNNTFGALSAGISFAVAGAVEKIFAEMKKHTGMPKFCVFMGGGAEYLKNLVELEQDIHIAVRQDSILLGMDFLWKNRDAEAFMHSSR